VEDGISTYQAQAVVLAGEERERLFARAADANPGWADYQTRTSRVLPVIALAPAGGPPPSTGPPGDSLKVIHDAFRRELALVRGEVATSGPGLGAQLRVNCLTVCQGLGHHHTLEDAQMFPFLAGQHPSLGPVLVRLRQEHRSVKRLIDELQNLLAASDTDPASMLVEVDRLVNELEGHLTYEEEQLIPLLNKPI
jgi:iron-sulfur cluster repair protein YtfE (RIC family)